MEFYVYAYLRISPKSGVIGSPYYIGKGTRKRAWAKFKKETHPPKDPSKISVIADNLTESEAFKLEIYLIRLYGRKDLGTGCLRNKTNGGDGTSGAIKTQAEKALRSELMKQKWSDPTFSKGLRR